MIGKLTGRLDAISTNAVILDVGGVGYEVTVGARTFGALPAVGEIVSLAIDTHVREDEIRLYGFITEHEASARGSRSRCSGRCRRRISPMPSPSATRVWCRVRLVSGPRSPCASSPN